MNNYKNRITDTPMHIRQLQIDSVMSKTNEERLRQCAEMIDFSYYQAIELMKRKNGSDDIELARIAYIEFAYKDDISKEYMDFIKSKIASRKIVEIF
jgi:hypothetical protein